MFLTFSKKIFEVLGNTVKGLHGKGLVSAALMKSKSLSGVSKTRHKQMPMLCCKTFLP
jgi:hypothetical protein